MQRYVMEKLAKKYGFFLHRKHRHLVFRDIYGRTVVTALSPSDNRAILNIEHEFRRAIKRPPPSKQRTSPPTQ